MFEERDRAIEEIAARLGVRADRGKRFAELTSLRVGGSIDWVIAPDTEEQAAAIVNELDQAGIGWRPLGSGSNVLADDGDHHYVVLNLSNMKGEVHIDGERVSVSAGYSLPRLCIDVARSGLSGIEGLGGIPGTVGGALWMNAGAYGHEIGTVTEDVRVARDGKVVDIAGESIQWNYRHTSFREGELLLGATLRLTKENQATRDTATRRALGRLFLQEPAGEHDRHREDHR
jgi:UDP-N-acetylmuramate dehydrogenase